MSTMKLTRLTAAQQARMPEWVEKWVQIGLSCEPADWENAEAGIQGCYQAAGLREPNVILRMSSPFGAILGGAMVAQVRAQVEAQVSDQVSAQVRAQVEAQVRAQVWDQVWIQVRAQVSDQISDQVRAQVSDEVRAQVRAQVEAQVRAQVRAQISDQVSAQISDQVRAQVSDQVWAHRGGQCWADWYAYVSFFRDVCDWTNPALHAYSFDEQHAKAASWAVYGRRVCAISDRPERVLRTSRGLHCVDGPALRYRDGWSIWALNGVRMTQAQVETPADALDPRSIIQERNAEVRRELVRKIGVEQLCQVCQATVVDRVGEMYELLALDLGDGRVRPYLKMRNPSLGVYHVEGCPPDIRTVQEALNWRASGDKTQSWAPEILT